MLKGVADFAQLPQVLLPKSKQVGDGEMGKRREKLKPAPMAFLGISNTSFFVSGNMFITRIIIG